MVGAASDVLKVTCRSHVCHHDLCEATAQTDLDVNIVNIGLSLLHAALDTIDIW